MFPATLSRASHGHVRKILIGALTALLLFATLVIAPSARAVDQNDADYWEDKFDHPATCYKHDPPTVSNPHGTITDEGKAVTLFTFNPAWPGDHWEALIVKAGSVDSDSGSGNAVYEHPSAGVPYFGPLNAGGQQPVVSHWIVCKGTSPDEPGIDIEKATNGADADNLTGPSVVVGSTVTWTYVVTNTGDVPLANVTVTDDQAGVTPVYQSGDTNTNNLLDLTETWTYTATGTATLGQYKNTGTAVGEYGEGSTVDDDDPSHYIGYIPTQDEPGIDIEKATNGADADNLTGPSVVVGSTVTWTYVVTNTGDVPLANVTVTDDQAGVTPVYQSGDTNTNNLLDLTETWTYTATGTATLGQYKNTGTAVGEYGEGSTVDDDDPSHYIGYIPTQDEPGIDIEKATNGADADNLTGPSVVVGSTVTWTYVVTNTGDVPLANVTVTDDQAGVTPVYQSGDTNTNNLLDLTETWTYTATGTATLGQYKNTGTAVGEYGEGSTVDDDDPSHYIGYRRTTGPDTPNIDIEKYTNTEDADFPTGPEVDVGSKVTWTYVVTNTGNVPLTNVKVVDDKLGAITCPKPTLIILEKMTCTASGKAELGQYANVGTVTGSYGSRTVNDKDPSHYKGVPASVVEGTAQLGDTVWLDVNKNGVQDSGEVGYNGADVILKDADGNVVGTLTTATGPWVGFYSFVGLDAGTYTAMLDLSTIGTYKVSTATAFTVTLAEGDEYLDADFGLYEDAAPPTTTVPPEETLPTTGLDSERLAVAAIALLILGALAVLATRRRRIEDQ